jgi:hypothetical protein
MRGGGEKAAQGCRILDAAPSIHYLKARRRV